MSKELVGYDALKQSAATRRRARYAQQVKAKPKARNAKRGGKRFPDRDVPELRAWIHTQPCVLYREYNVIGGPTCQGPVEVAHVVSRGAGGQDFDNTLPLCRNHHVESHRIGQQSFEKRHGINLEKLARKTTSLFLKERRTQ